MYQNSITGSNVGHVGIRQETVKPVLVAAMLAMACGRIV